MTPALSDAIAAILAAHAAWLRGEQDGNRAVLRGANLHEAKLHGADLHGADLREANLSRADLRYAVLRGADLRGADLYGADLRGANLRGANLYGANLSGATLGEADLCETNLLGVVGVVIGGQDVRGYLFCATQNKQGVLVLHAGCHAFVGISAARRHWQNRHVDNPLLHADCLSLVDRIERLAALRGWKLEPEVIE